MFLLPPAENPARAALQARADHFSNLVTWATIVVAVGVVLEGVEIVHDVIAWSKRKSREKHERVDLEEVAKIFPTGEVRRETESNSVHARWVKRLLRLGLITVVIGVVGEWRYGAKLEGAHNSIHEYDIAKLADADKKAGDVAISAKTAHDEADAVQTETAALTLRLKEASNKLDEIEQDTLAEGPRWRLLQRGEDVFIKALKPFSGQRATVVICGNGDPEREALEQLLLNIFPEAGWNKPGYIRWAGCPNMLTGGNEIYFVAATEDSAEWAGMPDQQWVKGMCGRFNISHDAVNTLCDVLYKLRIFTTAWREKPLPKEVGIQNARVFFGSPGAPDGPAELAYKDPGRIFLLIGPNAPMFTDKSKHAHKSTKPK